MLPLESRDFISKFFDNITEDYPHLTIQQVSEICRAPFSFIKQCIKSNGLPEIRIKYLGSFTVSPRRVFQTLEANEYLFSKGRVTKEQYEAKKEMLINHLSKHAPNKLEQYYSLYPREPKI